MHTKSRDEELHVSVKTFLREKNLSMIITMYCSTRFIVNASFSQDVSKLKQRVHNIHRKAKDLKRELKTTRPQQWSRLLEQAEKVFLEDLDATQEGLKKVWQEEEDLGIVKIEKEF